MTQIDTQKDIEQFAELLGDAILIANDSSEIIFANSACLELFGYSLHQMKQLSLADLMEEQFREKHSVLVKEFIQSKSAPKKMMARTVFPCINSKGELLSVRISIATIVMNSKPLGIATIEDFSEVQNQLTSLETETKIDPLTQLYNRRYLESVIEPNSRLMNMFERIGVLSLDLNMFKRLNDSYGHRSGDIVLKEVATRMRGALRFNDLVFKMDGDEFLILLNLNDCNDCAEEVRKIAIKIQSVISEPIKLNIGSVNVGVSIGAGVYPEDTDDLPELIKRTDEVVHSPKHSGSSISFVATA